MENIKSICGLVQDLENKYTSTQTKISEHVEFSQFDNVNRIEAYMSSKHISGDTDALGREKPFYNIVISAVNIWYRATKRKFRDIKIRADKEANVLASTMATIIYRDWANKNNFDKFLSQWGMTLATYGSAVSKWINRGDELDFSVVKWGNMICDTVDFENNLQVEKFYLTPDQLVNHKGYDKKVVKQLLNALTIRKNLRKENIDTKTGFIELYEVHGILPLSHITGKESDKDEYVQQMHVVSMLGSQADSSYEEFTLVKGREDTSPYRLTNLLPDTTGQRAMGKGAVELLFDSQWMTNHVQKLIKDSSDLFSKTIFQTEDEGFLGRNATNSIETGDILYHAQGKPITQVNNTSPNFTSLQSIGNQWQQLSLQLSATPEAMRGESPSSGTAYRTQQLAVNEAHSLFEEMGWNKDIALKEILRDFVIPFIKTKMDTTEEISAILDENDIKKIDAKFVKNSVNRKVNEKIIDMVLNEGKMVTQEEQAQMAQEAQGEMQNKLSELGNQRFFKPSDIDTKTWKDSIENFEWQVEIDTPSDQKDINLAMETLTTVLQTLANPATAPFIQTETGKFLLNKILTLTGTISPLELSDIQAAQDVKAQQMTQQAVQQIAPQSAEVTTPQVTT